VTAGCTSPFAPIRIDANVSRQRDFDPGPSTFVHRIWIWIALPDATPSAVAPGAAQNHCPMTSIPTIAG
jgi:hypothetical protein